MLGSSKPACMKRAAAFAVLTLVLLVSALVPRGYMIAPSQTGVFQVTLCPETNPLARMVTHKQSDEQRAAHAAMGHHFDADDEPASFSAQTGGDCAFSGTAGQGLAQTVDVWEDQFSVFEPLLLLPPYQEQGDTRALRLRPPLRGPPLKA